MYNKENKNLADLNREELIDLIYRQQEEIKKLNRLLTPGWGAWKFKDDDAEETEVN